MLSIQNRFNKFAENFKIKQVMEVDQQTDTGQLIFPYIQGIFLPLTFDTSLRQADIN